MPIENETKFVLDDPAGRLEAYLAACGIAGHEVLQSYVSEDTRIRRFTPLQGGDASYVFSFKRKVRGEQVEIETPMSAQDHARLLPLAGISFVKHRFKFHDGCVQWDVDFLKTRNGRASPPQTYFVLAEAEMPAGMREPDRLPGLVRAHLLHAVGKGGGFGARRLADVGYARKMLDGLRVRAARTGTEPSLDPALYDDQEARAALAA